MDGLFGNLLSQQNLPQLSLIGSLLSGKRGDDVGLKVSNFANAEIQQQNQERLNRANDLQQVSGLYKMALQQDAIKAAQDAAEGRDHVTDPNLGRLQQKMMELSGLPGMSGGLLSTAAPQAPAPSPQVPPAPTMPPVGQNFMGANPNYQPPPQSAQPQAPTQSQAPTLTPSQIALQRLQRQADAYSMGGFKDLADAINKRIAPIATKNGVYYPDPLNPGRVILGGGMMQPGSLNIGVGPDGKPSAAPLPNQVEGARELAAAQSGGKASGEFPYRIEMVKQADGRVLPTLISKVTGTPNAPPSPISVPPEVAAADASGKPFVATQAPDEPVQFQQPPKATQDDPWANLPRRYTPSGTGQTTFDEEMQRKQAQAASDLSVKLGGNAEAANQRLALNNQALDLVGQADTGPKAVQIADVKNWLVSRFGIDESHFNNTPSASIALQKDLVNAATQRAKQQFGSRITQSEVNLMLTRGAPNVDMTKAALIYLLKSDNAAQSYQLKQADDFGHYLQMGGDPQRFEAWYAKNFPMSQAVGQVKLPTENQAPQGKLQVNQTALVKARQAIQSGKDPAAVKQRLIQQGFDPTGL